MPNHITNVVMLSGDKKQIETLINSIKGEDKNLSFATYIPEPTQYPKIVETGSVLDTMPDWYLWRLKNWGTKWDAYEVSQWVNEGTSYKISFLTAWSTPLLAIETLSKLYPEIEISCRFADEDTGSNVGEYRFLNGEMSFDEILKYGEESVKMAEQIYQEADEIFNQ